VGYDKFPFHERYGSEGLSTVLVFPTVYVQFYKIITDQSGSSVCVFIPPGIRLF
jgi:hypothetical protein